MKKIFPSVLFLFTLQLAHSQEDLQTLVQTLSTDSNQVNYVIATFKGTRIINGESIETPGEGVLQFMISHRFGPVNAGAYNFFGLDQSTIRLGLDYGITNRINLGIGRSSMEKTFDGFLKVKLLRQSTGAIKMPVSVTFFGSSALNSLRPSETEQPIAFADRLTYTTQFLLGRKITEHLSVQLSPSYIHRNIVDTVGEEHDVFAIGAGARYKITKRISINGEYFYVLPGKTGATANEYFNSASIGFDIETGGHIFQLNFSNSMGMIEKFFIPETSEDWMNGGIHFGFNISRVFTIDSKHHGKGTNW